MNIGMMLSVLTSGWITRLFVLLLWGMAMTLPFFKDEVPDDLLMAIIGFGNILFYLLVAARVPSLVHQNMAKLLPHYFKSLKRSLLILFAISLLPTLAVLPNIVLWLDLVSVMLILAVWLVAMMYHLKYNYLFIIMMALPYPIEKFDVNFNGIAFGSIFSYLTPLIAIWAYRLLNKLETFKGNEKHIARMVAFASFSPKNPLGTEKQLPMESGNKFWRWLTNNNFFYYRDLIRSDKNITHSQLIKIACQGHSSVGRFTYLFWTLIVIAFIIFGRLIPTDSQRALIPMMIIFPAMLIATGTITVFITILQKKTLLQRLAIMPIFSKPNSFINAFHQYVIGSQVILYSFIAVVISALVLTFHHMPLAMYINVLYGSIILCLLNLAIILHAWRGNKIMTTVGIWLMVAIFISFMVLLVVTGDNKIILWQNHVFNGFSAIVVTLFIGVFYKNYSKFSFS